MNRECGPECTSCRALERINPINKYNDELFQTGCQNIVVQRAVPKRLVIGESLLEGVGFGAYITEPAKKGDYLGDYVGEVSCSLSSNIYFERHLTSQVITFKESERRAITYERKDSSFLFDLNSDWTIDAARQGNKTRYINHASNEQQGLNCSAKVVFVNGEHRIKFVALRNINVGEELLFDYGKKFANEHFDKKLGTVKAKKGVLTGNDLDDLDGLGEEMRSGRRKMAALRGGRGGGGRGRGKSRKTALPKRVDVIRQGSIRKSPDRPSETSSSDENEQEEEQDEGVERGRPRRKIRQPARYTR